MVALFTCLYFAVYLKGNVSAMGCAGKARSPQPGCGILVWVCSMLISHC